jgi:formiminoglutamate deiminase
MSRWWAEHAWLGGQRTTPGVLIEVNGGRFDVITPGVPASPAGAVRLDGLTLPGLANVHSHAFHRALRGRTHEGPGSFWTWRDLMYRVAERLDPDRYLRLAKAVFAEMVMAGFTAVGEFHYVHHGRGGIPYRDPNQMGLALIEAARLAGIRLTLLDVCYLQGGFGVPLEGAQLRFGDGSASGWIERVERLPPPDDGARMGAAVHSVRAVPPRAISQVAEWAAARGWPLHAHVSEQRREHAECRKTLGTTPLGVMAAAGAVGRRFTAVHGTHMSRKDISALAAARGGCCFCPTTERDLGDGIGPAAALHAAGVPLSLGSDSHAVIDAFEEARAMELDCRLACETRGVFDAGSLVEAASINGMCALGWDAGALVAGKLADFVTLRLDSRRTAGADPSLASTAVFAASAADVSVVVVGGKQIVRDGVHLGVPEVASELGTAIEAVVP